MIFEEKADDGSVTFLFGYGAHDPNRYQLCWCLPEQATEVGELLRQGLRLTRSFGTVLWTEADVHTVATERGLEVNDRWARAYLAEHESAMQRVATERGWDALGYFFPTTQAEVDAETAALDEPASLQG